ncbi:class I mannose-6-phosphate isomerase [Ruficoccus amylovorans]|uniref:Class I mannose-6-phosphate isomerase n=1 Tax=Ruficoccus amylovorans TaxID=1804625 RepID=A0A842HIN6_9BACT|nr:class I mannose-6-phosphate isomerase [Ruficoccus amylovorans]MBC2595444.1 class I mannose-6-phosphate isomerase [Ruficoccus amylovorans]
MLLNIPHLCNRPLVLSANRVWRSYLGGSLLDAIEGKPGGEDGHYPEDWIGSAVEAVNPREHARAGEGISSVELDGTHHRLDELYRAEPEYFFGRGHVERFGAQPEFLVKFIDSAERLHFQCHPTKAFSRERLDSPYGKFEAYYVLALRPGQETGEVYVGFQWPPEREALKRMIEEQDITGLTACFDPLSVKPGDVVIVPGGTPHALGAGVLLVEILEPSDWVVRFEYARGGYVLPEKDRFMGRGLDFGLDVFDLAPRSLDEVRARNVCQPQMMAADGRCRRERLIGEAQTDCFQVWKISWHGECRREVKSFCIAIVLKGACRLGGPGGWTATLKQYDRVLIPHGIGQLSLQTEDECELLECYPPQSAPETESLLS